MNERSKILEAVAIFAVMAAIMFVWPGDADAYENTCTTGDLARCIADPCQYVATYRFEWPENCDGSNAGLCNQCREPYNSCLDTATNVACGFAICQRGGRVMSYPRGRQIPGVGPTCPAGWVKVR